MSDRALLMRRLLSAMVGQSQGATPSLPVPPRPASPSVTVPATPPPLPAFQMPQGLSAYQPPVPSASPQGNYGPAWSTPTQAPQLPSPPAQWLGLGNQNRTAAFDPVRDAMDPRNVNAVDQSGQTLFGPYVMPR